MASDTQINCPSCNGFIDVIPGKSKYECPWCGSEVDLFKLKAAAGGDPAAPADGDVKLLVPFKQDEKALHSFVMNTVIQSDDAPDDILSAGNIESKELVYLPCWQVKGTSDIDWTASFGYDRQEPYTAYVTVNRNGRSYSRPVTRYRTVTDWRPASGKARATFTVRAYAGDGTPRETAEMLETALRGEPSVRYSPAFAAGYSVEPFASSPEDVRGRVEAQVQSIEAGEVLRHAQGDRQRDWRHSSSRSLEPAEKCLLPLARAVFSYGGRNYSIHADGVSFSSVRTDPLPKDVRRAGRIRRGWIPLLLAVAAAAASAAWQGVDYANPWLALGGPAAGLAYALLRKGAILGHSRRFRAATLAQKRLDENQQLGNLPYEEVEALKAQAVPPRMPLLARTGADALLLPALSLALAGAAAAGVLWEYLRFYLRYHGGG
ncbi:MAG: hypothetical protein LBG06_03930 [Deltaproteobacteria bacterium]|jgi:hypothetical protein|nr:hypothetical protein [Deltaproteobacteria bacterium]